jgi:hypothetical protein
VVPVVVALEPERFRLAGTPLRYVLTSVLMHRAVEMRALFTVILGLMLGSGTAAGFECTGVTLPSTIVICSDPDLMRLADERQTAINKARERIGEDRWPELWENQKAWGPILRYDVRCSSGSPAANSRAWLS